jgi:predicted nucleic acid-binding Zn ribbon protein
MSQETINMNITLDKTTAVECEECGAQTFKDVVMLRKASRFVTGTAQDALIPIQVFACTSCNHVNDEFLPTQLRNKDVQ